MGSGLGKDQRVERAPTILGYVAVALEGSLSRGLAYHLSSRPIPRLQGAALPL